MKSKSKLTTFLLILLTVCLIGAVAYISSLLVSKNGEVQTVVPVRTKAANVGYSKLIALNTVEREPTPTAQPTILATLTPVEISDSPSLNPTGVNETYNTPTPTEIILAYAEPTVIDDTSSSAQLSITRQPTKIKDLPDAGSIYNGLVIFAVAGLLVFFSFLF